MIEKFTMVQLVAYWNKRAPMWEVEVRAGERVFSKEIKELFQSLDYNSVLDYGCGTGSACKELFLNKEYVGMDLSEKMLRFATKQNPEAMFFHVKNPNNVEFNNMFDIIFTHTVLEHTPETSYRMLIGNMLDHCRLGIFVETDISIVKWGKDTPHGFDHNYREDLAIYDNVEVRRIKDFRADTNNSIFIAKGRHFKEIE